VERHSTILCAITVLSSLGVLMEHAASDSRDGRLSGPGDGILGKLKPEAGMVVFSNSILRSASFVYKKLSYCGICSCLLV
jgi:hypothetical protein